MVRPNRCWPRSPRWDGYRDTPDMAERAFRAYAALNADDRARFEERKAKLDRWVVAAHPRQSLEA